MFLYDYVIMWLLGAFFFPDFVGLCSSGVRGKQVGFTPVEFSVFENVCSVHLASSMVVLVDVGVYARMHACMCKYKCICTFVPLYVCMYLCMHMCMCVCMRAFVCAYACMHVSYVSYECVYAGMQACKYMHTHTHTHARL